MSKKFLFFVIFSLLAINVYTLICFHRFKNQSVAYQDKSENDELRSYKGNFAINIQNSNIQLDENVTVKDSLNNILLLKDVLNNNEQTLICRFSELYCESCVNFSIQLFRSCVNSVGKNNVVFLGAYRNNKVFNNLKSSYGIKNMNVYNVTTLNIPAEKLGFPYYFILNSDLRISNVFVPDKAAPTVTIDF